MSKYNKKQSKSPLKALQIYIVSRIFSVCALFLCSPPEHLYIVKHRKKLVGALWEAKKMYPLTCWWGSNYKCPVRLGKFDEKWKQRREKIIYEDGFYFLIKFDRKVYPLNLPYPALTNYRLLCSTIWLLSKKLFSN